MDEAYDVLAYFMLGIGIPILFLSARCVYILCNWEYWKNTFCRIFGNVFTFWNLLFWFRASWMGLFPDFFTLIRRVSWMPYADFAVRTLLSLSTLFSLATSANRFTAVHFFQWNNNEIWDPFMFVHLPIGTFFCGVIDYEHLMGQVEFVPIVDSTGRTRFVFQNYGLAGNIDLYWLCAQAVIDAALNIATIVKFIRLRRNSEKTKRSASENALYFDSFINFVSHCASSGIQVILRLGLCLHPLYLQYTFYPMWYLTLRMSSVNIFIDRLWIRVRKGRGNSEGKGPILDYI